MFAVRTGVRSTFTITEIGEPTQFAAVGVIVYTAVPAVEPVVVSSWDIFDPLLGEPPVTLFWLIVQANVAPLTLLVNEIPVVLPEQIVCDTGFAVTTGNGFTVMVITMGVPKHPVDETVGVIVYTAVPELLPVADKV